VNPLPRPRPFVAPALPFPEEQREPTLLGRNGPALRVSIAITGPSDRPWDHCPNCGERLQNHRCRYRCPRCFYFQSGSDFD
jgi:hypothetical protein